MHYANIQDIMDAYKQNLDELDIYCDDERFEDFKELIFEM